MTRLKKETIEADEEMENRLAFSHHAGRAITFEGAAHIVLDAAKNYFASGKDEIAEVLRKLSGELTKHAEVSRTEQRKHGLLP